MTVSQSWFSMFLLPLELWCRDGFCEQIETLGDVGSHGVIFACRYVFLAL